MVDSPVSMRRVRISSSAHCSPVHGRPIQGGIFEEALRVSSLSGDIENVSDLYVLFDLTPHQSQFLAALAL
jgi:hypothetical protein